MAVLESGEIVIVLWICVALLSVLLILILRIWRKLVQLEKQLKGQITQKSTPIIKTKSALIVTESPAAGADSSQASAFAEFLDEEPSRRDLSKGEQFSAFRKWRQEKGMNWSKP